VPEKTCTKCKQTKPVAAFGSKRGRGLREACKECVNAAQRVRDEARVAEADARDARAVEEQQARLASDFAALRAEDFDVSVGNDGRIDKAAAREKRQEFSRSMGEFAEGLRGAAVSNANGGDILVDMPEGLGAYMSKLAEQERRFGNRRDARAISLAEAHEVLAIRRFMRVASSVLRDRVTPTGYARRPSNAKIRRTVCLLLSDLHLGSDLHSLDEPVAFRATEEARRLEYILRQALDYKPQYRANSELLLILNGDIIEGQLMHDFRGGAALTEQKAIFWRYFRVFVALCAQQYPRVRVVCQPGNHGRDKVRHPGRATARKWDGHEFELYYALREMCSGLKNVEWQIDFRAVSIVDLYGLNLGVTHGDTEIKLGDPDTKSTDNARILDRVNSTRIYGVEFAAWAFGHYHKGRFQPRNPRIVWNAALVPPNGHARSSGYIGEPCGQMLWEAVEGFPVGDLRFIEVGAAQDRDEKLGKLIEPFRFTE
jgi:hypothetical protein